MRYWLGVVSREHVLRGVAGGFCQLCHGKAAPLRGSALYEPCPGFCGVGLGQALDKAAMDARSQAAIVFDRLKTPIYEGHRPMPQIQCYSYFSISSQTQTLRTGTDRLSHVTVENGNFDPAAITALLGIQPHRAWRQGDRNPLGKPYRFSHWCACLQKEPVLDAGQQCQRIALQLHDKIHALNALRQQYAVQFWIAVVPTMYPEASTPALSLGREVIEFCYLTGTQIDVDMYVYEATS